MTQGSSLRRAALARLRANLKRPTLLANQRYAQSIHLQMRQKTSASASLLDFAFNDTVKESIKTSFLDRASKEDSRLWRGDQTDSTPHWNGTNGSASNGDKGGVNDPIANQVDKLDDWSLDRSTKYWPNLPSNITMDSADPFALAKDELDDLSRSIREDLLGTDHPVLNKAAAYFFESSAGGKKVRPMMVLLLSRALADSYPGSLYTENSNNHHKSLSSSSLFSTPLEWQRHDLPSAQRRLAEISEMIHTASLFHDDVIDGADTRRGLPAVHNVFGSKVAILAGDYLLARASICLARLRNSEVIETMSTIIEHLVRGEIMQLRGTSTEERNIERLQYYLRKNYYKTGSLMANSCKSTALLGSYPPELVWASYRFGKHLGMAFQLVDDVLDFEGTVSELGKPALSDLNSGLSTAPVLFASEEFPELEPMMDRKFRSDGDVEKTVELVFKSNGIERTKELARVHSELAMEALLELDSGVYRDSLIALSHKVVSRTK